MNLLINSQTVPECYKFLVVTRTVPERIPVSGGCYSFTNMCHSISSPARPSHSRPKHISMLVPICAKKGNFSQGGANSLNQEQKVIFRSKSAIFWKISACFHPGFHTLDLRRIFEYHDDVIKWKLFPRYWPFVRGIHRSPVNSRTKASDAELWCFLGSAPE